MSRTPDPAPPPATSAGRQRPERAAARSKPPLRLGCIFLTWEKADPADLLRAVERVRDQEGDPVRILVVCQGVEPPPELPADVAVHRLGENVGIIAGRNAGFAALRDRFDVDVVLVLDDDGWLASPTTAETIRADFADDPELGIVSLRIEDAESGVTQRRHVPRLRAGDPDRSSEVTTFLGGASAIRTDVFDQVGAYPAEFYYGHEETDLAWRAMDAGWRIRYDARCVMYHPLTPPTKHPTYFRMNARNRVWLAKRHLPWPLVPFYLGTWVVLTLARTRTLSGLRAWSSGFIEGIDQPAGPRRPLRWRTIWRMTRLGRPPVI